MVAAEADNQGLWRKCTPMCLLGAHRCLYEHYPRPKEFILMHKIPDVLRRLLDIHGRGADAVHAACHQLLTAFQINVLL